MSYGLEKDSFLDRTPWACIANSPWQLRAAQEISIGPTDQATMDSGGRHCKRKRDRKERANAHSRSMVAILYLWRLFNHSLSLLSLLLPQLRPSTFFVAWSVEIASLKTMGNGCLKSIMNLVFQPEQKRYMLFFQLRPKTGRKAKMCVTAFLFFFTKRFLMHCPFSRFPSMCFCLVLWLASTAQTRKKLFVL